MSPGVAIPESCECAAGSPAMDSDHAQQAKSNGKEGGLEAPLLDLEARDLDFDGGPTTLLAEARKNMELALPVAFMGIVSYTLFGVSLAFVGRLGALHFAAASMASSFSNVFGYAILDGLSAGMETLGGQAHGAGQHRLLGVVLQRGIFVLLMACLPIAGIFTLASPILLALGQDAGIVELAARYVLVLLPGLFAAACLSPVQKFLEVQGVMVPMAVSACVVLLLSFPVNYVGIYALELGFLGAGAAYSMSTIFNLGFLLLYLQFESSGILERAWPGWSRDAFRDWGPFLKLAVPAMAMNCFEWWFFEVLLVLAGLLPDPEITLTAMNITFQTAGVCYMVHLGLSTAASVRVSNELGAQRPDRAKRAVVAAVCNSVLASGVLSVVLLLFRRRWALIFTTSDEVEVVALVAQLMPVIVASQFILSLSAVMSGILRGSGQQLAGSIVNGVTLWAVALPTSYYLAFRAGYGLQGLWWGLMVGVGLQSVMNVSLSFRTDWSHQAAKAFERVS